MRKKAFPVMTDLPFIQGAAHPFGQFRQLPAFGKSDPQEIPEGTDAGSGNLKGLEGNALYGLADLTETVRLSDEGQRQMQIVRGNKAAADAGRFHVPHDVQNGLSKPLIQLYGYEQTHDSKEAPRPVFTILMKCYFL